MMTLFRFIFFVALAFFVHVVHRACGFGQPDDGWQQTATIKSQTTVLNGTLQEVAFVNITISLYNYTQGSYQLVSDTVRKSLANIPVDIEQPREVLREYSGVNVRLPMTFNMTLVTVAKTGPKPVRGVGIICYCEVYAKKKHHSQVLQSLKHFSP